MPIRLWLLASLVCGGPVFAGAAPAGKAVPEVTPGKAVELTDREPQGTAVGWVTMSTGYQLVIQLEKIKITDAEKLTDYAKKLKPGDTFVVDALHQRKAKNEWTSDPREMAILRQVRPGARVEVEWYRITQAYSQFSATTLKLLQTFPQQGTVTGKVLKRFAASAFILELTNVPAGSEHLVGKHMTFNVPQVRPPGREPYESPSHQKQVRQISERDLVEVVYTGTDAGFLLGTLKVVGRASSDDGRKEPAPPPAPTPKSSKPPSKPPTDPPPPKPPADDDDF